MGDGDVELTPRATPNFRDRLLFAKRGSPSRIVRERVESLRDGDDPRQERDRFPNQALRIATPIMTLVMTGDEREQIFEGGAQEVGFGPQGVTAKRQHFDAFELARLRNDRGGHGQLADIVKGAGESEALEVLIGQTKSIAGRHGIYRDALAMSGLAGDVGVEFRQECAQIRLAPHSLNIKPLPG